MKFRIRSRRFDEHHIEFYDEMHDELQKYGWFIVKPKGKTFYAIAHDPEDNKKLIFMHHLILGYPNEGHVVDHLNGNGLDNRQENLECVPLIENIRRYEKKPREGFTEQK